MTPRLALVTGSSRGIGAAIADELRNQGWSLMLPGRSDLDLSDPISVDRFIGDLNSPVSGLVLNAAVNEPRGLESLDWGTWEATLQINMQSGLRLMTALLPGMKKEGFGRIVVVTSMYSRRARVGRATYGMTKAAMESLIRFVTVEYCAWGITANAVAPGFVDTDLTRKNNDDTAIAQLVERIPANRLARVVEVAEAVGFFMRPDNRYISGQVLAVDGGWSCT